MSSIEKQIEEGLRESESQIVERIKENLVESISTGYDWEIKQLADKSIQEFYIEHIAPEVVKILMSQKGEIISGIKKGAAGVGIAVAKSLVENAEKSLTGYSSRDILTKIVQG